ncbi:MAG: aminotransferase class IV, partial [Candidatus Margulisiibacteriota bacterium]
HNLEDDFLVFLAPFGAYLDVSKGINVCVSSWTRINDGMIPARAKVTGVYVNSAFSKTEAMLDGYDEAIVLNKDGHVSEGSAENIFLVRDGVLITPPACDDILEGITRSAIMKMAGEELGIQVIERSVDRTELYIADEIFLVGTGAQVSPVLTVDKRQVGDGQIGSITAKMQEIYFNAVKGNTPKYEKWLTGVY